MRLTEGPSWRRVAAERWPTWQEVRAESLGKPYRRPDDSAAVLGTRRRTVGLS